MLCSVNKFACAVTKWTKACDKRSARLISYIRRTCEFMEQFRLGLFQDSDFAGDFEDSDRHQMDSYAFRKPNTCAKKLDEQETDISLKNCFS